ncbi:MAG: NAD(P)-dependent oxidoreductase, partial [Phaeodactylibacter sp.]|nr:NAD(P)-dependent oxidoreductase [Phaeodactylibacter sp.]
MNIAFIGLGIMGSRMAGHLLKNGQSLHVYNRTATAAEALEPLGARVADTAVDAVADADVVFTMLSNPEVVADVATGEQGFLRHLKPGYLWVDCSTINPSFARQMADAAAKMEVRYLDAPVAGSKPQAEAAALAFFVGGTAEDLDTVRSLLEWMGSKVIHAGAVGQGAALKMLVNAMLAQSMVVFAESLLLGEKLGLEKSFLLD